jgi:hypothetical protein
MVDDCPGVTEIDNRIRVGSSSPASSATSPTVKSSTKQ